MSLSTALLHEQHRVHGLCPLMRVCTPSLRSRRLHRLALGSAGTIEEVVRNLKRGCDAQELAESALALRNLLHDAPSNKQLAIAAGGVSGLVKRMDKVAPTLRHPQRGLGGR